MFLEAENHKKIDGVKLSKVSPPISHLLFASDCFVFFRSNVRGFKAIKKIFKEFYWLSREKINYNKSKLFVSPNCSFQNRRWFGGILGCKCTSKPSKYLGIEIGAMNQKSRFFQPFLDKFNKKLVRWKTQLLSQGGRLTLIKSTLASLPNYILSCFKTSAFICKKIDQTLRGF